MINLIPQTEKENLSWQKDKKLSLLFGIAIFISLSCLGLVLLSVKYYILGISVAQKYTFEQAEIKYKTADFLAYKTLLENYNKNLSQIGLFFADQGRFSPALENFLKTEKPQGVYFTELYLRRKGGKIEGRLLGTAESREKLVLFKKSIESNNIIKNPNFSPESWINSKDVDFNLTFELQ